MQSSEFTYLIVGAGPGGIMVASQLSSLFPDKKILVLEKNPFTLETYIEKGYSKLSRFIDAMNDPNFSQTSVSTEKKTIWLGKGKGGGTLHFGLQFINTPDLVDASYPEWKEAFQRVTEILRPQTYAQPPSPAWKAIADALENGGQANAYRVYSNDIYARNIERNERLLIGSLLQDKTNITFLYDTLVDRLVWSDENTTKVRGVMDVQGLLYEATIVILALGAIQTPALLQRSGVGPKEVLDPLGIPVHHDLPVGKKMFDHAGLSLTYSNLPRSFSVLWNTPTLKTIHEKTGRYVYQLQGDGIPEEDRGKIYDFTEWVSKHPGGPPAIQQWVSKDFTLRFPHETSRWLMNQSRIGQPLGNYGQSTEISQLPEILQVAFQPYSLDSDTIVGYLQTRDPPNFSWQTYWNALPSTVKSPLIVTYALSTKIPDKGYVQITGRDPVQLPSITLNELEEEGVFYLLESVRKTEPVLQTLGWERIEKEPITASYIRDKYDSIYHYHGTCSIGNVVDMEFRVKGIQNLYLSDISVLPKPWGGSTSVPSLVVGYQVAHQVLSRLS